MKEPGRVVVLTGQTASGKTTLARYLERNGFERVVTYTTRSPRDGEQADKDYHFISKTEFLEKERTGFFAEYTEYRAKFGHVYYGTGKYSLETRGSVNKVIVLNPRGVMTLRQTGYDIFVVYLDFDQETLVRRALKRGDAPDEIGRRIADDTYLFGLLEADGFVDLHVTDPLLTYQQLSETLHSALQA